MPLQPSLLITDEISDTLAIPSLDEINVRGSYNPMQFVLRLNKDVQKDVNEIEQDMFIAGQLSEKTVQSYSTYLHETIHWWQHVGSNFGFISSLKFPAQAHVAYKDLNTLVTTKGAFKSILKYAVKNHVVDHNIINDRVNNILNYWYDIHFAGILTFDPTSISKYGSSPFFLSPGHCYQMLWRSSIMTLASTIDKQFSFIPDTFSWNPHFDELKTKLSPGFKEHSEIHIPPFGTKAIFEGQARFSQLQYLYFGNKGKLVMEDYGKIGMFKGIYIEAFTYFLKMMGKPMPQSPIDPLVGLFLLLCDIAINPTAGFPFGIDRYDIFIQSVDPGHRFCLLCEIVKRNQVDFLNAIQNYSKVEYVQVSNELCKKLGWKSPSDGSEHIAKTWASQKPVIELLEEEKVFKYKEENIPIRLFFSKFIRFQQDKFQNPQFFCWPGINSASHHKNELSIEEITRIFSKHQALYTENLDGEVRPFLSSLYDDNQVQETFQQFFQWNCQYDMIRNWIIQSGPFTYDYKWLSPNKSLQEIKDWIGTNFKTSFHCDPEEFQIL